MRGISSAPALPTPLIHRHARCESRALAQGMLCDGMPAGAQWYLGEALWWRLDSCLLAKHNAAVAKEDVRNQGEWSAWPILLKPAVVPLDDNSLALELIITQLLSWRKLLWHEERQIAARFDGSIDTGRCRLNEEGSSEIALGIDASSIDRPAWPQPCGHGTDSADVVLDRAVVGDVDAAAWVADSRFQTKPEPFGLADGGGYRPEKEDAGSDRDGDSADDRGPVRGCIQHDRPVHVRDCAPAAAPLAG